MSDAIRHENDRTSASRSALRDPSSLLLFAFVAIVLAIRTRYSLYGDLIFSYPFVSWDGYEWITERLHYVDPSIRVLHRNPGLPLIFVALDEVGALRLYPVLQSLSFFAFVVSLHAVVRRFVTPPIASFAVLTSFLCFKLHSTFDYVLADGWALLFMTLSIHLLLSAREEPRRLVLASAAAGLSFIFQFAMGFIAPAVLYFVFAGPPAAWLRERWRIVAAAVGVFAVVALPQFAYTLARFGTLIPPTKDPVQIVGFHGFGLFYYLVNALAWFGLPALVAIGVGVAASARSRRPEVRFVHLAALSTFVFWVLFYRWLDQRFLLYFVPFSAVYFALGVERLVAAIAGLRGGSRRVAAAVASAVWLVGASVTAAPIGLFTYDLLPLAPGWLLRFHQRQVGDFPGNVNITLDPAPERIDFPEWGQRFRTYYRRRWKDRQWIATGPLRSELVEVGARVQATVPLGAAIAVCGEALREHRMHHMILHSMRRNLEPGCDPRPRFVLAEVAEHAPPPGSWILHVGDRFVLYARPASPGAGAPAEAGGGSGPS